MTQSVYENIPVVALRGLVVLPGELLHFDAGRDKSVNALQEAMRREWEIKRMSRGDKLSIVMAGQPGAGGA